MSENKVQIGEGKAFVGMDTDRTSIENRLTMAAGVGQDNNVKQEAANVIMGDTVADNTIRENTKFYPQQQFSVDERIKLARNARQEDLRAAENSKQTHLNEVHEVATEKPWWLPIPKSWWKYLNQ